MPWRAQRGRRYYYRTVRNGSPPHSVYVGTGPVAEAVAAEVERRKTARLAHRQALASLTKAYDQAAGPLLQLNAEAEQILNQALTSAGYHRHDRGAWRRRKT